MKRRGYLFMHDTASSLDVANLVSLDPSVSQSRCNTGSVSVQRLFVFLPQYRTGNSGSL